MPGGEYQYTRSLLALAACTPVTSMVHGPPFPEFKARFSATVAWHFSRDLTRRLPIGWCGQSHVSAKHG